MILTTKCHKCNNEIKTRTWSSDRVEMAKDNGEFVKLSCKNCNAQEKYHVDNLYAQSSKTAQLISAIILILGTPIIMILIWEPLWRSNSGYAALAIGGLIAFPIAVYGLINKDERRKVNSFNRHKLKGLG